jgi:hypothetical protein
MARAPAVRGDYNTGWEPTEDIVAEGDVMEKRWLFALPLLLGAGLLSAADGTGPVKVPLARVHATTGQKEVRKMTTAMDGNGKYVAAYGAALAKLIGGLRGGPAAGFVTAEDIQGAVQASRSLFTERKPQEKLDLKGGKTALWGAVYFGTNGSSPPAWKIEVIEVDGKTVRVVYRKGAAATADIHHYLAWFPVPAEASGTYTLELFDIGKKEVTLKRQVKVSAK